MVKLKIFESFIKMMTIQSMNSAHFYTIGCDIENSFLVYLFFSPFLNKDSDGDDGSGGGEPEAPSTY